MAAGGRARRQGSDWPRDTFRGVLRALARWPFLGLRRLRWWRGSWSKDSDRAYHERLYEAQSYDPFSPSYPGYVTIRRFADHAEALLPPTGTVLDLGCGPGEITCELARRHPTLSFLGIDHSAQAIRRAGEHAAALGLTNARFEVGDAEHLPPDDRYALVTMFDAFHHLERPREFVAWLQARTSRCVLIEPAGTWSGGWARSLDVDWLLADVASIRERLDSVCDAPLHEPQPVPDGPSPAEAVPRGEGAVERRYALDDFARLFGDWQLRVVGTVAGIERYPPAAPRRSALGAVAGDIAYQLVRATEDELLRRDRDGGAKHWVVAATSEPGVLTPRLPAVPIARPDLPPSRVGGSCQVRYSGFDGPSQVAPDAEIRVAIDVENAGWDTWHSNGPTPVHVAYHWLTPDAAMIELDGRRTDLPTPLGPGETCRVVLAVDTPAARGDYLLAIDLVREGVTWFSEAGHPWHAARMSVR